MSKNFRGAQQITKELNTMVEQIDANEALLAQSSQLLQNLEAEAAAVAGEIARGQVEVEEARGNLAQIDFEFLSGAVALLKSLFEKSPYSEKLLAPLHAMALFTLEHTEAPGTSNPQDLEAQLAELNAQLEAAIAEEDFVTAESVQDQITALTAKLERMGISPQ
jgi:DNA repair exonuclease SbcCD ATPase subunit